MRFNKRQHKHHKTTGGSAPVPSPTPVPVNSSTTNSNQVIIPFQQPANPPVSGSSTTDIYVKLAGVQQQNDVYSNDGGATTKGGGRKHSTKTRTTTRMTTRTTRRTRRTRRTATRRIRKTKSRK